MLLLLTAKRYLQSKPARIHRAAIHTVSTVALATTEHQQRHSHGTLCQSDVSAAAARQPGSTYWCAAACSRTADMGQCCSPQERDEQAWSLLLHQDCIIKDTNSICRLLCVSLSMQHAVHHHAAGQLNLTVSVEQQGDHVGKRLCLWLASHAVLLRSLNFKQLSGLECSRPEKQQQIWHISSGTAAAQQHPMKPRVSSISSNVSAKVLLEVLPNVAHSLTRLELGPACTDELHKHLSKALASPASSRFSPSPSPSASPCSSSTVFPTDSIQTTLTDSADEQDATAAAGAPAPAAANGQHITGVSSSTAQVPVPCSAVLASLPALSHLVLHGYAANTLLPFVQPCTQLRSITLCNLLCPKAQLLRDMPAQLEVSLCAIYCMRCAMMPTTAQQDYNSLLLALHVAAYRQTNAQQGYALVLTAVAKSFSGRSADKLDWVGDSRSCALLVLACNLCRGCAVLCCPAGVACVS